jgi:hypothetical protein
MSFYPTSPGHMSSYLWPFESPDAHIQLAVMTFESGAEETEWRREKEKSNGLII